MGDEDALGSHSRGTDGIYWKQFRPTSWFLGGLALAQRYADSAATNRQFTGALTNSQSVLWICGKKAKFSLGVETERGETPALFNFKMRYNLLSLAKSP